MKPTATNFAMNLLPLKYGWMAIAAAGVVLCAHDTGAQQPDRQAERNPAAAAAATSAPKQAAPVRPNVRVTISKETTWITAPLRDDGYPDYVRNLNEQLRAGVTSDNNAAVLYVRAFGPAELPDEGRKRFFEMLGTKPLPDEGDYFVNWYEFALNVPDSELPPRRRKDETARDALVDQLYIAKERPWNGVEFPHVVRYLSENEDPLQLIAEGSLRKGFYAPRVGNTPESGFTDLLVRHTGELRNASRALAARAMLNLARGDRRAAWRDSLTIHRIADHLRGGPELDHLIGSVLDSMAWQVDTVLFRGDPKLDREQAREILTDLTKRPRREESLSQAIKHQRLAALDAVCLISRAGPETLAVMIDLPSFDFEKLIDNGPLPVPTKETVLTKLDRWQRERLVATVHERCDWDVSLRDLNAAFNTLDRALSTRDPATRAALTANLFADVRRAKDKSHSINWWSGVFQPREDLSRRVASLFVGLFVLAMEPTIKVDERFATQRRLILVGAALAVYRAEHGQYPENLDALAPTILPKVPVDAFGDRPFVYRRSPDDDKTGYVLYSLGENGKDDGAVNCRDGECMLDIVFHPDWSRFADAP